MFTGIVQGMGRVVSVEQPAADFRTHTVELPEDMAGGLQTGASVAHNGCCLTVTETDGRTARFDLMAETLDKTNLGRLKAGDLVNLERAARFGDEIGGHLMSGHITATTEILRIERTEHNTTMHFALPAALKPYILPKGFVGLDGCSLTIGSVGEDSFCVHLIPETLRRTLFGTRQAGDTVNLEIDPQTQAVVETVGRILAAKG
ncbi:riboflavin synthase subunit alpha [Neisseria elongata subsp. glycolytica ATCC 29315]|uniref:Riboflavin synthase n=1 Tax=Neisseria elongata subsp. glycolytica ATCC 29315 TaxID=546263 RepID=D4DPY3_NEIEG|nr:riboflavin synthase [Neisseria elongata]AJE18694.1 riboflavin synthase subunit alpha [Neisseria elongata subsp. glycolytica ATCC 29315]EFE50088.1 riboflavin synthase, alpha subunit [Neisseria elongata subsp. glycolytica ATCC 29315]SQH50581.1 riboflavin synthase subunit alpha [Neisseria elongata subsp. glycolytica]